VVFGPVDPGTYFQDANRFLAARWMHTGGGGSGSPGQGELTANGTFSTTLPPAGGAAITAHYTDGNGAAVNCLITQCYVVTMAAHGVADRSMDTCTPVSFAGGSATATVDSRCQPVATPTGQPTGGAGTPTGAGGSTGGSASASAGGTPGSGSSSTLPRTGAGTGMVALAGGLSLVSGLALVGRGRRRRTNGERVAGPGALDSTG
jgi:LPXTG-motif cell wall-anchored protein